MKIIVISSVFLYFYFFFKRDIYLFIYLMLELNWLKDGAAIIFLVEE